MKKLQLASLILLVSFVLAGCSGMDRRVREGGYLYYPTAIIQADKAIMDAKAAGKDKECPAEYNAAKAKVDEAYAVYHSCRTPESIEMANAVMKDIKALCPVKQAPPPPPAQKPAPPPPAVEEKPVQKAATPQKVIDRLTIHVNFDFDKSLIRKADEPELQKAVEFVKKYPKSQFRIEGHTDSIGTDKYNQKLSEKRAEAVKQYLVKKGGFDQARFDTAGIGETKPVASNKTKEGRFRNRRAEILVLSE